MNKCFFEDRNGSFCLNQPDKNGYLYFPLASEEELKSAVTPMLGGDAKINQNTFLLEPVSVENLHNNRGTRNFWCNVQGKGCWSATGVSAENIAKRFSEDLEECQVNAGFMWHRISRTSRKIGLKSEILSFVPKNRNVEVMQVKITNISTEEIEMVPSAIIPIYGRSADNLRDHRHVTSLLNRINISEYGVLVTPTLSFDERGHGLNTWTYYVCGMEGDGVAPEDFYPTIEDIIEEGGNFEQPYAVFVNKCGCTVGTKIEGKEAVGGLHFKKKKIKPEETVTYTILLGATQKIDDIDSITKEFRTTQQVQQIFEATQQYWVKQVGISYETKDTEFNCFMKWVSFQPMLRRIFGCSFLPYHDYGKGGRGWRDLWQDCLALSIVNPGQVRQMLIDNFAGVRMDGSNATIIGTRQGEFLADRNNITRVWMDHGVWPFMTTALYIEQTGDIGLLEARTVYFKDKQIMRGTQKDALWSEKDACWQWTEYGELYKGSVLEHLLLQNLTAFYEVGQHNIIRLRGADWNDALDMASEHGESVAFSNAYAGNLKELAKLLKIYKEKTGNITVELAKEMLILLKDSQSLYESVDDKRKLLSAYMESCSHFVSGTVVDVAIEEIVQSLNNKAEWMQQHIRKNEWVQDAAGNGWFNGYYDNHGNAVEGEFAQGIRMMLTSQVFSIMCGTARQEQIEAIIKSADTYLYDEQIGGYRLNTNFKELKLDLGRMFGFSYGDKENGAVFSHMAVMYANALYTKKHVRAGYKALNALYKQSMNFEKSRIYPGIPEYFDGEGRGRYHYLTGAASWYMLTVVTEMFGVHGEVGNLALEPKLLAEQFDEEGMAAIQMPFGERDWRIIYHNRDFKEYGEYLIAGVSLDGIDIRLKENAEKVIISKEILESCEKDKVHVLNIILK